MNTTRLNTSMRWSWYKISCVWEQNNSQSSCTIPIGPHISCTKVAYSKLLKLAPNSFDSVDLAMCKHSLKKVPVAKQKCSCNVHVLCLLNHHDIFLKITTGCLPLYMYIQTYTNHKKTNLFINQFIQMCIYTNYKKQYCNHKRDICTFSYCA